MCIDLFSNPTVIGAIIGALVGAIASIVLATTVSCYKFNKRKKGAYALIHSEFNYIIDLLNKFRDKYVKEEIKSEDRDKLGELYNFYAYMSNFPICTNTNWMSLISFIPSIFKEEEIYKINQFYAKYKELADVADDLSNEKPPDIAGYIKGEIEENKSTPFKNVNNHRNNFRKDLNELTQLGEEVKDIFK